MSFTKAERVMLTSRQMANVMIAFDEGSEIEYRQWRFDSSRQYWEVSEWGVPFGRPSWAWSNLEYRIKLDKPREPRELLVYFD